MRAGDEHDRDSPLGRGRWRDRASAGPSAASRSAASA